MHEFFHHQTALAVIAGYQQLAQAILLGHKAHHLVVIIHHRQAGEFVLQQDVHHRRQLRAGLHRRRVLGHQGPHNQFAHGCLLGTCLNLS